MGRPVRSTVVDKENTPRAGVKARLRSSKTPLASVTPRKALGDIHHNVADSPLPTPAKRSTRNKAVEKTAQHPPLAAAAPSLPVDVEAVEEKLALPEHPKTTESSETKKMPCQEMERHDIEQFEGNSDGVSSRPPCFQHLSNDDWEYLQMTEGPDHIAFWWRAAEDRRKALKELIDEKVQVYQQNRQLREEVQRLRSKESEAWYFSLMARLWELESST